MPTRQPAFEAQLVRDGVTLANLETARRHAAHEHVALAEAVVSLEFLTERDTYATLARSAALPLLDLTQADASPLAVRLVSERIARRHMVVPIAVDNYDAIAHMRRAVAPTMPIVVLTSEDGPGVERRVLDLGADDYIVKPFDAPVLLSRVHSVFRRLAAAVAA